ncbi:MAG TPA: dihydropteroate synthase [Acidimicrobiia bacterium]|nr:dihydropteroate synthase [Acidimicrobiia bacterium]
MTRSWMVRGGAIALTRPLLMGVVNTTPDSFSDGGLLPTVDAAVAHAHRLIDGGADVIDVGGESTRPGALPVTLDEEMDRVLPVVSRLADDAVLVSVDTTKPEVADACLRAGAVIVNDVGGMGDPAMRRVAVSHGAGVVVMHMQGEPRTMQDNPTYDDVVVDIRNFLIERRDGLVAAGADPASVVVDPGIGFGKTVAHNLILLNRLGEFAEVGPIMVGASRKRFLGALSGRDVASERDFASAVAAAAAILRGASILRVHDVAQTLEAVKVAWAIVREEGARWAPVAARGVAEG